MDGQIFIGVKTKKQLFDWTQSQQEKRTQKTPPPPQKKKNSENEEPRRTQRPSFTLRMLAVDIASDLGKVSSLILKLAGPCCPFLSHSLIVCFWSFLLLYIIFGLLVHHDLHMICSGRYGLDNGLVVVLPNLLKGLQFISFQGRRLKPK